MTSSNHHQNFIVLIVVTVITQLFHLYKEYHAWHSECTITMCTYLKKKLQTLLVKGRHLMVPLVCLTSSTATTNRSVMQELLPLFSFVQHSETN